MDLKTALADVTERFGDKTAFMQGERALSFRQLENDSNRVASGLVKLGVNPGDRVALLMENSPDFPVVYFGIVKMGAIAVPLDTKYKWLELKAVFDNCQPVMVIGENACLKAIANKLASLPYIKYKVCMGTETLPGALAHSTLVGAGAGKIECEPKDTDAAHIAYTSGPTLRARGAVISHGALFATAKASADGFKQTSDDRVILFALPMHHTIGIAVIMLTSIMSGSTVVMLGGISIEALFATIEREKITIFHGVPFIHAMVVNHLKEKGLSNDIGSLRFAGTAGAPIPVEVIADFEKLTGKNLINFYGLTESTSHVSCQPINRSGQNG